MFGSKGGGVAVSLNWSHLPRVDVAEDRLRERQHCPWREEFFKLIAILPRQTFGEVLALTPPAYRPQKNHPSPATAATGASGAISGIVGFGIRRRNSMIDRSI